MHKANATRLLPDNPDHLDDIGAWELEKGNPETIDRWEEGGARLAAIDNTI